jgi:DnaJ-class molecular chaperone
VPEATDLRAHIRTGNYNGWDVVRVYEIERSEKVVSIEVCDTCRGNGIVGEKQQCRECGGRGQ